MSHTAPLLRRTSGQWFSIAVPPGSVHEDGKYRNSHFWTSPGGARVGVARNEVSASAKKPSRFTATRVDPESGVRTHTLTVKDGNVVAVVVVASGDGESDLPAAVLGSFRLRDDPRPEGVLRGVLRRLRSLLQ